MNRILFLLFAFLTGFGLSLVDAQQRTRAKFVALEHAKAEQKHLVLERSRLEYEQSMLAQSGRISELVSNTLHMIVPTPKDTLYLSLSESLVISPMPQVKP